MEHSTVKEILEATGGRLLCGRADTPLSHISIDSRNMKGNDLFVPLVGEKVDAHRFIGQAFDNGAAAVFTSEHDAMEDERPWIRVEDTKKALQDVGAWYRSRLALPLVGITGSVGKTTTREMVACALSAKYRVYKTPANHNSQVGVPITMTEISEQDEIGVIELGMSEPGELTVIAQIARIQMAVITNIGITHIEQLGSQENIYKEKLTIQDGLTEHGILFLNGDDEMLKKTRGRDGFQTIYYGTGENCHYRAVDVRLEDGYPAFTAVYEEERVPVRLKVMGSHNVNNAMVSLAVASVCGIPMKDAAEKLAEFTGFKNRQQIYRVNGMTVIDDTYNASPVSMKAGLEVLHSISDSRRKIAVLADMKELGPDSPRFHYEIGAYIAEHPINKVAVLGELAKEIARGVRERTPDTLVYEFMDRESLAAWLKTELREGDTVLFKGSNSMELGKVAAMFLERMDKESIIRALFREVVDQNADGMKRFIAENAIVRWHTTNEQFTVSEYIRANCEYPGKWQGEIERLDVTGKAAVSAARVWCQDSGVSFHVVSFFEWEGDKIAGIDEYWGDDGPAPAWRLEKKLGRRIHEA